MASGLVRRSFERKLEGCSSPKRSVSFRNNKFKSSFTEWRSRFRKNNNSPSISSINEL
jgi:hypothetical protein